MAQRVLWMAALGALGAAGCGKSAVSQLRTSTPAEAAAEVMELHDANKDGKIASAELQSSLALAGSLRHIDSNRDGAIDRSEMQARFEAHDDMSDVIAFDVQVLSNRAPLGNAVVTFTPEPFMGEGKQAYTGATTPGGVSYLKGEEVAMPGVPVGFYKVQIVHEASGVNVTQGCEVADDLPTANRMEFDVRRLVAAPPRATRR